MAERMSDLVYIQGQLREHCIRKGWVLPRPGDMTEMAWAKEGLQESTAQIRARERREREALHA